MTSSKDPLPKLSVLCLTYNHREFIKSTLDGFLLQKTSFNFEVLIHDDASTDGTQEVIREFTDKYPRFFKPILQKENQWQKGINPTHKYNWPRVKGEYVAMCEGDDYWTDPLKLEKQVRFLDNNPEYSLSHSNCDFLYNSTGVLQSNVNEGYENWQSDRNSTFEKLIDFSLKIRTPTVVYRRDMREGYDSVSKRYMMGDTPLMLYLSQKGKFHYLSESTAVYRITKGTASRSNHRLKQLKFNLSGCLVRYDACLNYSFEIPEILRKRAKESALEYYFLGGEDLGSEYEGLFSAEIKRQLARLKKNNLFQRSCWALVNKPNYLIQKIKRKLT